MARLIYMECTTWCVFKKVLNGNDIFNTLWPFWVHCDAFQSHKCTCCIPTPNKRRFGEYLDDFVVLYVNDIFIFAKNTEDHEHHVHLILDKFKEVKIYAKLEKYEFDEIKMKSLNYIISKYDIHMNPHTICGLCYFNLCLMFYWIHQLLLMFCPHYSTTVAFLNHSIHKDQSFA
jgi:hypothetical protein